MSERSPTVMGSLSLYEHSLGEVVDATIAAGLRTRSAGSRGDRGRSPCVVLRVYGEHGRYRLEVSGERLPVLFTLMATAPPDHTPQTRTSPAKRAQEGPLPTRSPVEPGPP
jgi:hypothetical protein